MMSRENSGSWGTTSFLGLVLKDDDIKSRDFKSPLCIPWDNLDDLEYYPSFSDDWIPLSGLLLTPDTPSLDSGDVIIKDSVEVKVDERTCPGSALVHGSRKKPRSKGITKKKPCKSFSKMSLVQRKSCSHCQAEETPQWRTGPMGPKTLCNACGVRYKSRGLFPEYRPVASPSFDGSKHSNYHRKIMQRKSCL